MMKASTITRISELAPEQLEVRIREWGQAFKARNQDPQVRAALKAHLVEKERRQIVAFADEQLAAAIVTYQEKVRAGSRGGGEVLERLMKEEARRRNIANPLGTSAPTARDGAVSADQLRRRVPTNSGPRPRGTTNEAAACSRTAGRSAMVVCDVVPRCETKTAEVDSRYRGVGGWLLFWCICLTIVAPLLALGMFIAGMHQASQHFDRFPGLQGILVFDGLLSAGVVTFGVYAGIALWTVKRNAISVAKTYLFVALATAAFSNLVLPLMAGFPPEATGAMLKEGLRAMIWPYIGFSIWNSYLKKSKRIKATFPDQ